MECAKMLVKCTECNIEWEEPKPELPTHYPIDRIDKMPYSHEFYNIQIKEMREQKAGEWFYCQSCESFVSDDFGLFKAQYHPEKDLLPIHAFFLKTQIVSESTFFEWIKNNLSTESNDGEGRMFRFPGINRYHFTYSVMVDDKNLIDSIRKRDREEAMVNLDVILSLKEVELEHQRRIIAELKERSRIQKNKIIEIGFQNLRPKNPFE